MPYSNLNSDDSNIIYNIWEDFTGSLSGSELGMSFSGTNGAIAPTTSGIAEADLREGIRRLRTGTVVGLSRAMDGSSVGQGQIHLANYVTQTQWVLRLEGDLASANNYELLFGWATGIGIQPTIGVYFYYNPTLYGDTFFRARYVRGALSYEKVTTIQMGAGTNWHQFRLTHYYGANYSIPYFDFGHRLWDSSLMLVPPDTNTTITQAEILTVAGLVMPYKSSDGLQIVTGIQKNGISAAFREMYVDKIQFQKRYA